MPKPVSAYVIISFILLWSSWWCKLMVISICGNEDLSCWCDGSWAQNIQHSTNCIRIFQWMFHFFGKLLAPCWTGNCRSGRKSKQCDPAVCYVLLCMCVRERGRLLYYSPMFVCQGGKPRQCLSSDEDMCCLSYFTPHTHGLQPCSKESTCTPV